MPAKIAIIYYSTWGHIATLAEEVKRGVEKESDVTVDIFQVSETLPTEVLTKMHAPEKRSHPIATPQTLLDYDAFLCGIPTRYGTWPAQWKNFWDATGQIWATGGYHGKLAGVFISTGSQHGGIESTGLTALTTFIHHGIIFVP
eukprot:TRINITY_DN2235_c0_g1_i7.p1 TRINITY_DN2235_c0_g1~~TRINITY_DN2235_c0_g1_i7.p1  ORF type:complete len:144 (-),score=53.65 TRINITY_DN2235_c0_g1_i7:237-668(-)